MKTPITVAGVALLAGAALALSAHRQDAVRPSLERIRALAGEWVRADEAGRPTDELVTRYRVTAGGSAVLEELFPGTEMEMLTVYHMDGEDLVLTHYCVAGNQPRMRAVAGDDPDTLDWTCTGGANIVSGDEGHMHAAHVRFLGPDRLSTRWRYLEKGEFTHDAAFELVRRR